MAIPPFLGGILTFAGGEVLSDHCERNREVEKIKP
jgi:hypothetical protein